MRIIATSVLLLMLAGCTTKQPTMTAQEEDDARAALLACLHDAARKLDDGKSEASTIALALRNPCAREFAKMTDAVDARAPNPAAARIYHQRYDDQLFTQTATQVVLDERAERAGRR